MFELDKLSFEELYILSRYFYRIGQPIIADSTYDALHEEMVESNSLKEYTSRTYDDDEVPVDLLLKVGYINVPVENSTQRDISFLVEDKSKSIKSVDNMKAVFDFCLRFRNKELVLSIKMDGNNIKSEISDQKLKLSLTRGRASNGIDVTDAMLRVFPKEVKISGHQVLIGEVFLPPEHLPYVRKKYGEEAKYKTSKSAAISFLRRTVDHSEEDYKLLDFRVFSCDGLSDTVTGTYEELKQAGFRVPPYVLLENIPDDFGQFEIFMDNLMKSMRAIQLEQGLPADGLVLELNNLSVETEVKDQYDERQIALKFGPWSSSISKGRIKSILVEQQRVFCSTRVEIEPILTDDGCEATYINVFNPSFLFEGKLSVGSEIAFERQSGAVNVMINNKKVKVSTSDAESDE